MRLFLAAVLLLIPGASPVAAQTAAAEAFAREADAVRRELRIPGMSLAVVQDGRIILATGLGFADRERGVAATADTRYPIGSITKTFTSTLMLGLADEGRLDLDRDVRELVDWRVEPGIRIRHVLSHTSEGTPGARFSYSSRFNWLDNVVDSATGERFRDLMTRRVLQRAKLTHTVPAEDDAAAGVALAQPYRAAADGEMEPGEPPPRGLHSSSGLTSTVTDLARYSIAIDEGRLHSAAGRERAFTPAISNAGDTLPYALGWFSQRVNGERAVWHGSWWPNAYSGLLLKVPSRGLTLVLLANSDALSSVNAGTSNVMLYPIANAFLRRFTGESAELAATARVAAAMTLRARGSTAASDSAMRSVLECCARDLKSIGDADRLRLFGGSDDAVVRAEAFAAGERILAAYPDDVATRFDLALAAGRVRPSLRINGPDGDRAVELLAAVLESPRPLPNWMEAWSAYLVADYLAEREPARAKRLAGRAAATGVDTDGLQARIRELVARRGW